MVKIFKASIFILFVLLISSKIVFSQTKQPVKEVRAIWVTTAWNLDWPGNASGALAQQTVAIGILDAMKRNNYNTVVLQVRARGDLLYPSTIEPWARYLAGAIGRNPGWNPLQFWIDEAHKRGMELHAWWNVANITYGTSPTPAEGSVPHVSTAHPDWVKTVGTEGMFMDLGYPDARQYLVNLAMEMVNNYNIDAIHFDYIRYSQYVDNDWDQYTFTNYNPSGMNRADWRRENINIFVRAVYNQIKAVKPWVKVGSAPVGVYSTGIPGVGAALYGYSAVYCDSKKWLAEGVHDYLTPQIYWNLEGNTPYLNILNDWVNSRNGRHIYGGVGAYQVSTTNPTNNVYPNISRIIEATRGTQSQGNFYYRYADIAQNDHVAVKSSYLYPANIPPMPWIDNTPPSAPQNLTITRINDRTFRLTWDIASMASYYNIYRSISSTIDYTDGANLYYITTNNDNSFTVNFPEPPTRNYYFAVTALSSGHVESVPSNIVQSTNAIGNPIAIIDPASIEFGNVLVSNFNTKTFKITNNGTADLVISSMNITGVNAGLFTFTPSSSITIRPTESRDIIVQFLPTSVGVKNANLNINHNGSPSTTVVPLTGIGVQPSIAIDPTNIEFGDVIVSNSSNKALKITNDGTADLAISSMNITGTDTTLFTFTPTAPITITPSQSRDIAVQFLPTSVGVKNGQLNINHNSPDPVTVVSLTGTGITASAEVIPIAINFGTVQVGLQNDSAVYVTNTGTIDINITGISITGDTIQFIANPVSVTLRPGENQRILVTFKPTSLDTKQATLNVATSVGTLTVQLTGTGAGTPVIVVDSTSIEFGDVIVSNSSNKTFKITNDGNVELIISSMNITGTDPTLFSVTSTIPITIPSSQNSDIIVQFLPTSIGVKSANLNINHNGSPSTTVVTLAGRGVTVSADVAPTAIDFGTLQIGLQSDTAVYITNTGSIDINITGVNITGGDANSFVNSSVTVTLGHGENQRIPVSFKPTSLGTKQATLNIATSVGTLTAQLTGTGAGTPVIAIDSTSINFGDVEVGKDKDLLIAIKNTGNGDLRIIRLEVTGTNALLFTLIGTTTDIPIAPLANHTATVRFIPDVVGPKVATLKVVSNVGDVNVSLSGNAITPISVNEPADIMGDGSTFLFQSSPNPIRLGYDATIRYRLNTSCTINLTVYDVLGREVAKLVDEYKPLGIYSVNFNTKNLPSGVYFYRLRVPGYEAQKKMVIIR